MTAEPKKQLKVVCCAFGEMGHLIPMSHIADALLEAGHNVYFVTNSDEYNGNKASKTLNGIGLAPENQIFTKDGLKREQFLAPPKSSTDSPEENMIGGWQPFAIEEIKKIKPDIVLCDFVSRAGILAADELGIPSICNIPGLFEFVDNFGLSQMINIGKGSRCCGMVCYTEGLGTAFMKFLGRMFFPKQTMEYWGSYNRRVVFMNSFWGLDAAATVPPNYILTGPLTRAQDTLVGDLEKKDPELFAWLADAQEKNEKVVYLSLGSIAFWEAWSIEAMYFGLKKQGCRVIWSLKNFKMPEENEKFWVREWIPQVEVLAHPAVKAGLTHCGFGGVAEFITAGLPIVGFPHMYDQSDNAQECAKRKIAVVLADRGPSQEADQTKLFSYKDPVFDKEKVYEVFNEILTNPIYQENIKRLQRIQKTSGGRALAVKTVEDLVEIGSDHLVDHAAVKNYESLSWCTCCLFWMFVIGVFAALTTFTVLYFMEEGAAKDATAGTAAPADPPK